MDNTTVIDNIVETLFYAFPIIHKKLMRIDPPDLHCGIRLTRLHVGILAMLNENTSSISEIANTFLIPNPQMTYLIDRMLEAGLVERISNAWDRRVTDLVLTAKGKETFRLCDDCIKNNVRAMLSFLNGKELDELLDSLTKLKQIGPKLGRGQKQKL